MQDDGDCEWDARWGEDQGGLNRWDFGQNGETWHFQVEYVC